MNYRLFGIWSTVAVVVTLAIVELVFSTSADAATIASTSFENESLGTQYRDTDLSNDHDLVNNAGQSRVNSTAAGSGAAGDLGFLARISKVTIDEGLTDGDDVGVVGTAPGPSTPFPDGTKGYQFSDTDGLMTLTFDPVAISPSLPTSFSIDYFINDTSWETADRISIFLTIDGSTTVSIIDTTNQDIDGLGGIEEQWLRGEADLTGLGSSVVLSVLFRSDAAVEALWIDRVIFSNVPEPSSIAILLLGVVAACSSRRR